MSKDGKMEKILFYRPEWVCGRYNAENSVAICYNLLEGMVYLFEDESAKVVREFLQLGRNCEISISEISSKISIDIDEIKDFFLELSKLGLITTECPTTEFIAEYRRNLIEYRKQIAKESIKSIHESSVLINHDDVEMQYMERCGGIFSLMIELTYNCSEKCIHCYNPGATRNDSEKSGRATDNPLSLAEYKRVIDELDEQGLVKVCLTGGDPFSNPLAWDLIEYLWQKEIVIDIFTNGQQLVGKAQRLADYYPRTLGISLYSGKEEVHDAITRVDGSFQRTLSFISDCSELGIPMLLKCCIMKPNVSSYFKVKDIAFKYGMVPQFDLNITDSLDGDKCASKYLRLNREMMEVVLRDPDLPYYINGSRDSKINAFQMQNEEMCNAGVNSLCLTPSGDIQPCCAFPLKCGNVRDFSLIEIMNSNAINLWRYRKAHSETECMTHSYCEFCQLCAGNNYNSTGDYLKPSENNCFLAQERYNLNNKMKQGYDPLNGKDIDSILENIEIPSIRLHRVK